MARCRSCDAPIVWAKASASGKPMPLDPPDDKGNVIVAAGVAYVFANTAVADEEMGRYPSPDVTRHFSHFVTCPQAARHRRR